MKKIICFLVLFSVLLCGCKAQQKDGTTLLKEERYEAAKEAFREDIRQKKNLDRAYYGAGIACFELGQYEEAVGYFLQALDYHAKQEGLISSFLGACYMELGEYGKALDAYERALADETLSVHLEQEAEYNLIAVYEKMGNWEAAKTQLNRYSQKYPNDTRIEKEQDFLGKR